MTPTLARPHCEADAAEPRRVRLGGDWTLSSALEVAEQLRTHLLSHLFQHPLVVFIYRKKSVIMLYTNNVTEFQRVIYQHYCSFKSSKYRLVGRSG